MMEHLVSICTRALIPR